MSACRAGEQTSERAASPQHDGVQATEAAPAFCPALATTAARALPLAGGAVVAAAPVASPPDWSVPGRRGEHLGWS